jgi:hypothetical protein
LKPGPFRGGSTRLKKMARYYAARRPIGPDDLLKEVATRGLDFVGDSSIVARLLKHLQRPKVIPLVGLQDKARIS